MKAGLLGIVPLVLLVFSGCLDNGGGHGAKAFDPVSAPVWETGYSWTYEVTSSYHSTYAERGRPVTDSETESAEVVFTVVNSTLDVDGEPVYYVRSSQQMDHPFMRGTLQALTKAGLAQAAYAYADYGHYDRPQPVPSSEFHMGSSPYPPQPKDPCDGVTVMNRVDADERPPGLQFPLDDGQTWTGTWGEDGDDVPIFSYTSKVHGMTPVKVAAGVFPSVYVETDFEPDIPEELREYGVSMDFDIQSEVWYSPDARQVSKMVVSAEMSGAESDGPMSAASFAFISTMTLKDFELTPAPAEALSVVLREEYDGYSSRPKQWRSFSIVADKELPIEVGKGPVTVTLGLESFDDYRGYDGRIQGRPSGVPSTAAIDHETHEIVWVIGRVGEWEWTEVRGDTATYTLEDGGRYSVQAHIQPLKCGEESRNYVGGELTTTYTRTYDLKMEPGLPGTFKAGDLPIASELSGLTISWSLKPTAGTVVDKGHLVLVNPHGEKRSIYANPHKDSYLYPEGQWRLEWVSDQVTVGDDVQIVVKASYDPWSAH